MSSTLSSGNEISVGGESHAPWFAAPPVYDLGLAMPQWYLDFQAQAWQEFLELPEPIHRDQNWRFADLRKLRFSELIVARPVEQVEELIERAKTERLEEFAAHYVFANGRLIYSEEADLPAGLICQPINEALAAHSDLVKEHFMSEADSLGGAKFRALHGAATLSGLFIRADRNCVVEKPIVVHHFSGGEFQAVFPHTTIVAEANASVSVVDLFESIAEEEQHIVIGDVSLEAKDGGRIQYVALQDESDVGPKHVQLNRSAAGRDAQIASAFVNLGGSWVRNESINRMQEKGGDIQIFSANLANGSQEYDQRTMQIHEAQHTTSDLLFKNALYDTSRTIFSGLIQVNEGSHHTDSYQTCRNLLGSEQAEANAMPGLEIDADQVRCSHGSTSGQISDEEIFYLQARGIPAEHARQMISLGFLNESLEKLSGDELKQVLFERIERKFASLRTDTISQVTLDE